MRLISPDALAQYMAFRGLTVRSLADKARCSHSTIGHLRSGARKNCRPEIAAAIEKALDAPRGSLFVATVLRVARKDAA